jgi:UPF0716 family protein affecting phage T7 exclusion
MFVLRFLIKWVDIITIKGYLNKCLTFSLISFLNFMASLYLFYIIGAVPTFFILLSGNFIFYLILSHRLGRLVNDIRTACNRGDYPVNLFEHMAALLTAAPLLILPGPVSFLIAAVVMGPLRLRVGYTVSRWFRIDWKDVYEYLKLDSDDSRLV